MAAAREDISHALAFDYLVVNDQFEEALVDLLSITRAERLVMDRQSRRQAPLLESLLA